MAVLSKEAERHICLTRKIISLKIFFRSLLKQVYSDAENGLITLNWLNAIDLVVTVDVVKNLVVTEKVLIYSVINAKVIIQD